jgi:hypothetical protein
MKTTQQQKQLDGLFIDLSEDIKNLRSGKLPINQANAISKMAHTAIKANIAVAVEHQKIQLAKNRIRLQELDFKKQELDYKKIRFKV